MNTEKVILQSLLSVIAEIADANFQQFAWVEGKKHIYCSFEESMHQFFDDLNAKDVIEKFHSYGITDIQLKALSELYQHLDEYSDEKMSWHETANPVEILNDPKWHNIQTLAQTTLKAFDYKDIT